MTITTRISAVAASTALLFSGIAPAMAAPIHTGNTVATPMDISAFGWSAEHETAASWHGYRGHRHHRNRVDGGDILAGILVIGGIAAIASAASKNNRDRRSDDRDYRSERQRHNDWRAENRSRSNSDRGTGGMESAINVCSSAAERQAGRDARVVAIESVARDGDGWRVEGELSNSNRDRFLCGATDGRVDFVQIGNGDLAFAN